MLNKVIVFDFDKTLTYRDTLFAFFRFSSQKNILFPFKYSAYLILMIFAKINLISNTRLKKLGVFIFLRGKSVSKIDNISELYAKHIKFNNLFSHYNFNQKQNIYVVSASFDIYLNKIFPVNVKIISSQLQFSAKTITGLKNNCFKAQKVKALAKENIYKINELYTDSYSDFSLANISEKIIIVNGDDLYECNDIEEFNRYFKK